MKVSAACPEMLSQIHAAHDSKYSVGSSTLVSTKTNILFLKTVTVSKKDLI